MITYDINTTLKDYASFYDAIKQIGYSYKHPQESTWFIATRMPIDIGKTVQYLRSFLARMDTILIVELTSETILDGWLSNNFWDWYKSNVS